MKVKPILKAQAKLQSSNAEDGSNVLKNSKWEAFAQAIADGKSETEAYQFVYNSTKRTAYSSAPRLLGNVVVRARVRELKKQNARAKALSRERKREILASIAEDSTLDARARISAIQEDNRMTGDSADNLNLKNEPITFNLGGLFSGD